MPQYIRVIMILLLALSLGASVAVTFSKGEVTHITLLNKSNNIGELEKRIEHVLSRAQTTEISEVELEITRLLRKAPLNDNALVYYRSLLKLNGDWRDFNPKLFSLVMSRNPRNRKNLYAFLDYSIRAGDFMSILQIIELLYRIDIGNRKKLLNIVNATYNTARGRVIVDDYLARNPSWEQHFLYTQAQNLTSQNLQAVTESIKKSIESSKDISIREKPIKLLLYALIKEGHVNEAFDVWRMTIQKLKAQQKIPLLENIESLNYNPTFINIKSPPPFNWEYHRIENSFVETNNQGGLYLSFKGSNSKVLATQYFIPSSGQISMNVEADYNYKNGQGNFSIVSKCLAPRNDNLHFVMVLDAQPTERNLTSTFNGFGADCLLASIEVMANPKMLNNRISVNFSSILVTSADGAQ